MLFRRKYYHSLIAGLACAALLTGCAAGRGGRAPRARMNVWPEAWPQPFWNRTEAQPDYQPIPADPSGSPYSPNSPRGLYVPSGPAPESKLGLPVPPPLPPGRANESPAPEEEAVPLPIPPAAEEMDVSLESRSSTRPPVVAPPPPPEPLATPLPRVAERTDEFDRRRQFVDLQTPEVVSDDQPSTRSMERSPVEAFPRPRLSNENLDRGPGHTPAIEDDDESLPNGVDRSAHRPSTKLPGPLPRLRDPEESDLGFPGVNKQMSGVGRTRSPKVDAAVSRLSVREFQLTRDARSGDEASVISAQDLRRGQHLVVQTELDGLEKIERNGDSITRTTSHIELRDAQNKVAYHTDKQSAAEVNQVSRDSRHLSQWLSIPARLKAGNYTLLLYVHDDVAKQTVTVEMPVTIR
ncbi:MAG: hypothetical protein JWN70_4002 [Planctomycetaceae bacterium]|nr:hypothetical protein [Planctomycetaceae bacterium]